MKNRNHTLYIFFVCLMATIIYTISYKQSTGFDYYSFLFWSLFGFISESFHLILPSGASTSVGMAVYLAALVTGNPFMAINISIISFLTRAPIIDGERKHLFKFKPSIVLYNVSSHVIVIGLMGFIYNQIIDLSSTFSEKMVIGLILFSISELISIILISIYFYTRELNQEIPLVKTFIGALPSTWAVGALGMFLAFAEIHYNKAAVALFFIPLLLARYSFKLYFDSQKMGMETIHALNDALFMRDAYTGGHTSRVEMYSTILAKAMKYTPKDLECLQTAAKLHDIGKIGIPDGILNKPGKLTADEYSKIKDHSVMGAKILNNVDAFKKISEAVRYHHERPDGKGYPEGLVGDAIPRDSAILSIADTFDAMTTDRPYRKGLTFDQAMSELKLYKGTQFNSALVELFILNAHEFEAMLNLKEKMEKEAEEDEKEVDESTAATHLATSVLAADEKATYKVDHQNDISSDKDSKLDTLETVYETLEEVGV